MKIAFYGSSILSSYWNGAATYYRGVIRALHQRGHRCVFFEPRAFDRQLHADMEAPPWCEVVVYEPTKAGLTGTLERLVEFDVVIKTSGVGVLDDVIPELVFKSRRSHLQVFWDVDAPATLAALAADGEHPLRRWIKSVDVVFAYGGGQDVLRRLRAFGARRSRVIYNALDSEAHFPVEKDPNFAADLTFMGNRLPDRERRIEEFFEKPARLLPASQFLLGGSGWEEKRFQKNIRRIGHVPSSRHNAVNASARAVLNVARDSMAEAGFSPATRVFEAAGAGACIITDAWNGVDTFLKPGEEILVARDGIDVAEALAGLSARRARNIGRAARARILRDHTYDQRAQEVEAEFFAALNEREVA